MATQKTGQLGSLELPDTSDYRVVGLAATYLDATETIGADGKPTVVYVSRVGYRGETLKLNDYEARRLVDLGTVKRFDEPLAYDEMTVEQLKDKANERDLEVVGSGADGGVLKEDLINAHVLYDQGVANSTDSGVAVAASTPGGVTVSDAVDQSGRRVRA